MGFVWVYVESFLHSVASSFHYFVTTDSQQCQVNVLMGFVWEHADSFLHCVASPFHSFVTIDGNDSFPWTRLASGRSKPWSLTTGPWPLICRSQQLISCTTQKHCSFVRCASAARSRDDMLVRVLGDRLAESVATSRACCSHKLYVQSTLRYGISRCIAPIPMIAGRK